MIDPKTHPRPCPLPEGPLLWVRPSVVGPAFPVPAEELLGSSVGRLGVVSQEKVTLRLTRHWFSSVAQAALQEAQRVEKPTKAKARAGLCPLQGRSWQSREVGWFPDSAIPPAPPTAALLYLLVRSRQESSCTASLLPCLPPALKPERGQKLPGAEPRRDSSGGCHFGKVWEGFGMTPASTRCQGSSSLCQ